MNDICARGATYLNEKKSISSEHGEHCERCETFLPFKSRGIQRRSSSSPLTAEVAKKKKKEKEVDGMKKGGYGCAG